jgi:hypothetical protein
MDCTRENILAAAGLAMKQDREVLVANPDLALHPVDQHGIVARKLMQPSKPVCRNLTTLGPRCPGADWRRNPARAQQGAVSASQLDIFLR